MTPSIIPSSTSAGKESSGLKERRARGRPKANAAGGAAASTPSVKRSIKSGDEQHLVDPASKPTAAQ